MCLAPQLALAQRGPQVTAVEHSRRQAALCCEIVVVERQPAVGQSKQSNFFVPGSDDCFLHELQPLVMPSFCGSPGLAPLRRPLLCPGSPLGHLGSTVGAAVLQQHSQPALVRQPFSRPVCVPQLPCTPCRASIGFRASGGTSASFPPW